MDSRHAHGALSLRPAKTDRNDALGLATLVRMGWYKSVHVRSGASQLVRAQLAARAQLVKARSELDVQLRGLLRGFGLKLGKAKGRAFAARVRDLVSARRELEIVTEPLLAAREALIEQIGRFDADLQSLATATPACRRLMTLPGVGVMTAVAYLCALDEPARFSRSANVGAYFGLTPRRYQSGALDRGGRISKCGDALVRHYLFEAANVLLTRVSRGCALKAWALRLANRIGLKKAKVALARKLAVVMFAMLRDQSEFRWVEPKTA